MKVPAKLYGLRPLYVLKKLCASDDYIDYHDEHFGDDYGAS